MSKPLSELVPAAERQALVLAIDIGGTFTDVTLHDSTTGQAWTAKTASTPADPSVAFITGMRLVLEQAGRGAKQLSRVLHGTTVATNLILEGKGAATALITTKGFRHVLEIGRQDFPRRANLWSWVKPHRPVPPARVFEVVGRIGAAGQELTPLDEASLRQAVADAVESGAQAIAICLLHAWANFAQEARAAAIESCSAVWKASRSGVIRARYSLARSLVPMTKVVRCERVAAAAISWMLRIASGISIITQSAKPSAAPADFSAASSRSISRALVTLGASTACAPAATAISRSAWPHSVSRPFIRTTSSRGPYPPAFNAAAMAARASALASGATASSRSRISVSARISRAFSSARVLAPGM